MGKREREINAKNTVTRTKWGFPHGSVRKESACNAGIRLQCKRPRFDSWVWKISWRRKWQPTPVCLPGEPRGHRSLAATDHGGPKSGACGLAAKPAPPREHSRQKHGNTTGESKKETHLLNLKTCDTYCHLMIFFVVGVFDDVRKGSCPSFLPISPP